MKIRVAKAPDTQWGEGKVHLAVEYGWLLGGRSPGQYVRVCDGGYLPEEPQPGTLEDVTCRRCLNTKAVKEGRIR